MRITVDAAAKVNLSLAILGRLPNGYHELAMVMQSVSLYDTVTVETLPKGGGRVLTCDAKGVPCDERNIAWRAADAFFAAAGLPPVPLAIRIQKRIPSEAGLGGGSADGAAVLAALQYLYREPLSADKLLEAGLSVGADIPFCLTGGTALAKGVGEKLTPLPPLPDCTLLLAKPKAGVSTAAAYAAYDRADGSISPDPAALIAALSEGDLSKIAAKMENVFEALVPLPDVAKLREMILSCGALGSRMSGSGSAVFGIFADHAAAAACKSECEKRGLWAAIARPVHKGVTIREAET